MNTVLWVLAREPGRVFRIRQPMEKMTAIGKDLSGTLCWLSKPKCSRQVFLRQKRTTQKPEVPETQ
jgi:hypothetical protein